MQSPLLHQISSMRDSLMHDDAQNYHSLAGMAHQPRSVHGGLPLASLASSSGGLASTILDIAATSSSHLSASTSSTSSFEQSKSDADLAHYLATSNTTARNDPSPAHSLNREPTLMSTSLSGGWGSGHIFDRQGSFSVSWGDSMPSIHSTTAPPIEATPSSSSSSSTTASTTDAAPEPASIRPYHARGESYLLPPIPSHSPDHTWSPSTSLDPSAFTAPLSHPVSPTLIHYRVNVNTGPRMPIQRMSSPHEHEQRYVTLAEITALPSAPIPRSTSSSAGGSRGKRRFSDEEEVEEGMASKRPRLFLRDISGSAAAPSPPSQTSGSGSPVESGSRSAGDVGGKDDEEEEEEDDDDEEYGDGDESDSSFDADDSGEFVPGRRSTRTTATRRRPAKQREREEGSGKGKAPAKRVVSYEKTTGSSRRSGGARKLRSAAEALRVVTEMANASKASGREASVSAPALSPSPPVMDVHSPDALTLDPELEPGLVFSSESTSSAVKTEADAAGIYGGGLGSLPSSSDSSSSTPANPYAVYSPSAMLSPPQAGNALYPHSPYAMNFTMSAGGAYPFALATSLTGPGTGPHYSPLSSYYMPPPSRPRRSCASLPVPVPNLIKKSRGRRVPAPEEAGAGGPSGEQRTFVCTVEGCGKCFVRGEHLKRHMRSIHTYEKPHLCPYEGCGKTFSRRDNLAQHARIHLG